MNSVAGQQTNERILINCTYQDVRRELLLQVYRDTINQKTNGRGNSFHLRRRSKYPRVRVEVQFPDAIASKLHRDLKPTTVSLPEYIQRVTDYADEEALRLHQEHREFDTFRNKTILDNDDLERIGIKEFKSRARALWQALLVSIMVDSTIRALWYYGMLDILDPTERAHYKEATGYITRLSTEGFQTAREIQAISCL